MRPTYTLKRRAGTGYVLAFLMLLGMTLSLLLASAAPAQAAEGDPYQINGVVELDRKPLEGIRIEVDGPGGKQKVVTDADGRWSVKVPEKAVYTVTLVEDTLPDGIAVVDQPEEGEEADESPNVKEAEVKAGGRVTQNFFIGEGTRNPTGFFDQLIVRVIQGLNFGLMLGLAAVGLSLVFGTTGISNFAHGEMVTFGAIAGLVLVGPTSLMLPWQIGLPLAIVLSGIFGLVLDMVLWRPLRKRGVGVVQLMIVSIGLSLALRYSFQFFFGGEVYRLPNSSTESIPLFGAVEMTVIDMVSIGISVVVIVAFALWLTRSRLGKATRAISDNPSLAAAAGIDVDFVVRVVWIVSSALAGLAGILYAYYRPGIRWDMGTQVLLLMFAAVTLGGLGTAFGALIGALIVGVLVEISGLWIPSDLRYAAALLILIVILLIRPQGILGRRERVG